MEGLMWHQKNRQLKVITSLLPLLRDVIFESKLLFARMEANLQPSQFSGLCPLEPYLFFFLVVETLNAFVKAALSVGSIEGITLPIRVN
jgi:hypothetical protein